MEDQQNKEYAITYSKKKAVSNGIKRTLRKFGPCFGTTEVVE